MPTNTPIGTVSTGNVGTAAWANSVANLNSAIGLYGVDGTLAGSAPPAGAPNFLPQGGVQTVTFTGGFGVLTFPNAFPNGLLVCLVGVGANANTAIVNINSGGSWSASAVSLYCIVNGSGPTGNVNVSYMAWGF